MEWIWFTIASLGAGAGRGLACLNASVIMAPILIGFCPSFMGEGGAWQAMTAALVSDLLASAVKARKWVIPGKAERSNSLVPLMCSLAACPVGSLAARLAGDAVLGGAAVVLTLLTGIF